MLRGLVEPFLQRLHQGFQGYHTCFQVPHRGQACFQCLDIGLDFGWGQFPKFLWQCGMRVHGARVRHR
jgi:hypothetical protein